MIDLLFRSSENGQRIFARQNEICHRDQVNPVKKRLHIFPPVSAFSNELSLGKNGTKVNILKNIHIKKGNHETFRTDILIHL